MGMGEVERHIAMVHESGVWRQRNRKEQRIVERGDILPLWNDRSVVMMASPIHD